MHLKELELYGFKSFGERVKIEFNPRLTAIVGPNGSGKSNIVDSVRWLLGDQSHKSLRVPSSEEVIFKGDENGTPFNFSHVGMVIELDDEGEMHIERRYHRSGENDYILNGKTVRLKDIRNLMSSEGFGLGSLSILSQGQIDSILSLVPSDRRVVLEEVAQISHFKDNKARILKKLDATRENLTRLDDIIREVDSRIKELSEQAEMTRKFKQLDSRRRELEVDLSFKETERFIKNIKKNLTDLQDKEKELFDLREESTEYSSRINSLESEIDELREKLDHEIEMSRQRSLDLEKARSSMDLAHSDLESWQDKRMANLQSLKKLENQLSNTQATLEEEKNKLGNAEKDKNDAESRLTSTLEKHKDQIDAEESSLKDIEKRTEQISKLRTEIDLISGHISMLEERSNRAHEYLQDGDEAFNDRISELERFRKRSEEFKQNLSELKNQHETLIQKRNELDKNLSDIETEIDKLELDLSEKKDELIGISSELKILNDLESKLAGYHAGVKRLIAARDENKLEGIIGPVIDLIDVEKGFERALEAAFAGRGQYIVVETFNCGLKALSYLKETGGGRVTFIPLDDFNPGEHSSNIPQIDSSEGFLGRAVDLISVEDKFKSIAGHLLKDALVFKDLNSARNARKKYKLKQWIVTLDGEVHQPGGIFTGGAIDHRSEGPLVRRSQIEELENRKKNCENETTNLFDHLNSSKSLRADFQYKLKKLQDEILAKKEEINDSTTELTYNDALIQNHEKEITELKGRREKIENEIASISAEIVESQNRLKQYEEDLDYTAGDSANDEERRNKILQDRSLREDEINRLRILISSKEQEMSFINSTKDELAKRYESLEEEIDSVNSELVYILDKEESLQARYVKLKYSYEIESEKIERETSAESSLRKQIDDKRSELVNSRKKSVETSAKIEEIDARRETQSVRIAKMETELVSVLKKVADIESVKSQFPELLDTDSEDFNRFLESEFVDNLPSRKAIVDELNEVVEKIEEIGEVNVLAERDYENYLRRKEFLDNQKEDLVKAADELMKTLSEIEQESRKAFKEIFESTQENFREIFTMLFPEGTAGLSLTDPQNILESGLEIRVKFPGKTEHDLLQFSGGERSIIAIAFLFAVLKTKPPSFVILDEVEAALDDVNVENFIKLMRTFSDKFQFIIVTHNKLTMEYASDLWGVTMRKGGMSQVVSISLEEWIEEHPETVN